jgi:hypothetical protein
MPNTISTKTLIPISIASAIGLGSFYLSAGNSKIETNTAKINKNEVAIQSHVVETNKSYIEIIQRLTRIEEAVKK